MAASKTLTPEQRRERARKAGRAAHSIDAHVRAVVDRAPELTADQVAKLRAIFAPAVNG
ncbi:hypothetical protein FHX75_13515 [Micromonospora palomenae]|uniref:Uncharacterized protein n=1 Tax=Micromonospora palomenae TaxID=1461247 RepID=A0A561VPC8_9ACTN|nr:hypothetical protein [Micromonospora palomenae]TWG13471.1 hypothetical protein FHX75_13515 [Micromonospora palomenae]